MANRPGTVVAIWWSTLTGASSALRPGMTGCIGPLTVEAAIALPMVRPQNFIETGRTASLSSWKAGTISLFT